MVILSSIVPSWGSAKTPNANAGKSLFTNSVTYCLPPQGIIVSSFNFKYYQANESGSFDLSVAFSSNINPEVTASVEVYGKYPVNWTISVCDILDGVLCPLPKNNFTGGSTLPIPDEITSLIPSIAWSVPDLEIYVTLLINDAYSGESVSCLQATLSNGWSTEQYAVLWASAAFVLLAIGVSWLHTCLNYCRVDDAILAKHGPYSTATTASAGIITGSSSPGQGRIVDIVYFFQTMTFVGMLGIDYPNVFPHFVLNFRWAVGLYYVGAVQRAINKARHLTGAKLPDTAYPSVLLVNRKSTYVQAIGGETSSSPLVAAYALPSAGSSNGSASDSILSRSLPAPHMLLPRADVPATDTLNQSTAIPNGIPVYSNAINISTANTWMTVFFTWLMVIAVFLAIHLAAWGLLWLLVKLRAGKQTTGSLREKNAAKYDRTSWVVDTNSWWGERLLANFHLVFLTNALRLNLMMFFPICVFTLWQFTLNDAWLPIFLAAVVLVWTLLFLVVAEGSLSVASRRSHSIAANAGGRPLRSSPSHAPSGTSSDAPSNATLTESVGRINSFTGRLSMYSPFPLFRPAASGLYQPFRRPLRLFWLVPVVIPGFLKACFIAFGQQHGFLQLIALVVIEGLTLVALLVARPYTSKKADWIGVLLALFRLVGTGLPFAFFDRLHAGGIAKTVIGIVCIAVWGIMVVILFIGVWFNLFWGIFWKRHYPQAPVEVEDFVATDHQGFISTGGIDQSEKVSDVPADRFIDDDLREHGYMDESMNVSEDRYMNESERSMENRYAGESDSIRPFSRPEEPSPVWAVEDERRQTRPL
ncbi:TRP-like family [Phaffia rhodozyma]|uniref:TRP-like family n=1 Tax=Phaffia rhodozyma TaxID=264483 RepID=A0A0F7SES0_PHARH|nr:TRP-like family [Phaffia rhodozyma]